MTHEDKGHYADKHPAGLEIKPEIVKAVQAKASKDQISCAAVFSIVKELDVEPSDIGVSLDFQEISITKCQLGLFGYGPEKKAIKPADHVPQDVERAIREVVMNGRVMCKDAWKIAEQFGLKKMDISSMCEALKIKIGSCQLGAFT
jgi:hypothetical protein